MRTNLKVMDDDAVEESTTASAGAIASPVLQEQLAIETARGAERASLLRRLMLMSDLAAALCAGAVGAVAGGMGVPQAIGFAAIVALGWLVLVFMGGLYTVDTLGAWASGIPRSAACRPSPSSSAGHSSAWPSCSAPGRRWSPPSWPRP